MMMLLKRILLILSGLAAVIILLNSGNHLITAKAADVNKEWMITSVNHEGALVANKEVQWVVHVANIDPSEETMKDVENALVLLYIQKDDDKRQVQLKSAGGGDYKAAIKLPSSGEWTVKVAALKKDEQLEKQKPATMETTVDVQSPDYSGMITWIAIAVIVIILLILLFWLSRRRRKK